jgi:hypothetical protein
MITDDVAWLLVEACRHLQKPMRGLKVCELGNQVSGWKLRVSVKQIMQWLGAEHTSIDLNGLDGALKLDLSKPLPNFLLGRFDLVTNAGTTEHVVVENDKIDFSDQWQAFLSIHGLLKPTAAIIHVLPSEKGFHCGCGYVYTHQFFLKLAEMCYYRIVECYDSLSDKDHVATLMMKSPISRFPTLEEFQSIGEILLTEAHPSRHDARVSNNH